jgi:hypothetical protein
MLSRSSTATFTANCCLAALFLVMIALPVTWNLVGPPSGGAVGENRAPIPLPQLLVKGRGLRSFPLQFDAFFNDRFGFRNMLLDCLSEVDYRWLHVPPSPKVILGKRGWLFFTEQAPGFDYDARKPFTKTQLSQWQRMLEARRDWLARRGIHYLFIVVPDKQTVYPEFLPHELRHEQTADSRLEQLMTFLHEHSDVPVLDLREALTLAKIRDQVYSRTDSHWNGRGAYVGYRETMQRLDMLPTHPPQPRSAFAETCWNVPGGDCAQLLGFRDRIRDDYFDLQPRTPVQACLADPSIPQPVSPTEPLFAMEQPAAQLPRAVMFRDSFGAQLVPFLAEHFRRIVFCWQNAPAFDTDLITREKPDIVIQEIVERKLSLPELADTTEMSPPPPAEGEADLCRTEEEWLVRFHGPR